MKERINLLPLELRPVDKGRFYLFAVSSIIIYVAFLYYVYASNNLKVAYLGVDRIKLQQEVALLKVKTKLYQAISENIKNADEE